MTKETKTALRRLKLSYNSAKNRWCFMGERTWKQALKWFGEESEDERPVTLKELKEYYEQKAANIETSSRNQLHKSTDTLLDDAEIKNGESDRQVKEISLDIITKGGIEEISSTTGEVQIASKYLAKFPTQSATLIIPSICKQEKAARDLFVGIEQGKSGQLLLAQTGAGKTYILASMIKNFIEHGWIGRLGCVSPWPILFVTKASIVDQTAKVLSDEFGIDTINTAHVINIEQLRAKLGKIFIEEDTRFVGGEPVPVYKWRQFLYPCLIVWDECQILAREESIQSKIAQAFNDIENAKAFQVFSSATPFARVSEARCFACATGASFFGGNKITNLNWHMFAHDIAAPAHPEEYVEAAVNRLTDFLEPYIVRVKGIRPKHKALNSTRVIQFPNAEAAQRYQEAWNKFCEEKAKIEGEDYSGSYMAVLVELMIFSMAAEIEKAPIIADWFDECWREGYAPVAAIRFKATISKIVRILIEEKGWSRDDISLIWGGSAESMTTKKKLALKIQHNDQFKDILDSMGLSVEDVTGVDISRLKEKAADQLEFERKYHLLQQKPEDRERERLRFQRQDSRGCLFTFKSGGVGLSLHHEAKYPRARQRKLRLTPVYSEKELVQALGRCPRITSESDTEQIMLYFARTIEEAVAARVIMKLKCLKQVVRARESWEDIITGRKLMRHHGTLEREHNILDTIDAFEQSSNEMVNEMMEFQEEQKLLTMN